MDNILENTTGQYPPVAVADMIKARDIRAEKQKQLLDEYHSTVISCTMNIAGPVKNSLLIRRGFDTGIASLKRSLASEPIHILRKESVKAATGNEALFVVDRDPLSIKKITCGIEESSPIGRLFDFDVIAPDGRKIGRKEAGFPERACLICGKPAKICARSRSHPLSELAFETTKILMSGIKEYWGARICREAVRALLYEASTTPKPGLVDRNNNGSHADMSFATFIDSSTALMPYFRDCTRIGIETSAMAPEGTFNELIHLGKTAENIMYEATGGINTHKGAIYSLGILCGAYGRLILKPIEKITLQVLLDECSDMVKASVDQYFRDLSPETARTEGGRLYLQYHIRGVRGQAADGFPAVRKYGLPVLEAGLMKGMDINDAGCCALLWIIANNDDTNIIHRSSRELQHEIADSLREHLGNDPYPSKQFIENLDRQFITQNISPGGSADLLSVCYFLHFLTALHLLEE